MSLALALTLALLLDAALGEPEPLWRRLPHPAVLMGRLVGALERRLNTGDPRRRRLTGALAVGALVVVFGGVGWAIAALPVVGPIASVLAAAILLAQRSLADHVRAVADGLEVGLVDGRLAVSMIVGRDPETLDEAGVARAAIESAAENFSDGVAAPAFWFLVAGLPGVAIYKAVNTADSMIGYRSERYRAFGWAAARLDDALNLAPARLTGALICLVGGGWRAARVMLRDAPRHKSPNAGWPEAATAATLDLALAGPRIYDGAVTDDPWLNAEGRRDADATDIRKAVALIWRAWVGLVAIVAAIALLVWLI